MKAERRYKIGEVTAASRDGWQAFTRAHGGNPTVLIEVIGLHLATLEETPHRHLPALLRQWLAEAQEIEHARRRRPQGDDS